jgi:hypothetical protein
MSFFDQRNTNYFNQMQVNKLQFGQSNYKLDQISLELIFKFESKETLPLLQWQKKKDKI